MAADLHGDAAYAEDATYTPDGGSAVSLSRSEGKGAVLEESRDEADMFSTGHRRSRISITIPQSAVSGRPADGDVLSMDDTGRTFRIRAAWPDPASVIWHLDVDEQ